MATTHFKGPLAIDGDNVVEIVNSSVNYVELKSSATGSAPTVTSKGTDANIDLQLTPTGTGVVLPGSFGSATISQVAAGAGAGITINAQRGSITIPDFDISSGSSVLINLTNNKLFGGATPRLLMTSIGRGANTINGAITTQTTMGTGSALIQVISGTTTVQDGSILVNFVVM